MKVRERVERSQIETRLRWSRGAVIRIEWRQRYEGSQECGMKDGGANVGLC